MTIKLTIELIRFLNAAKRLYSQGFMKKEEILDFARREFGEISGVLKTRLDQIFKKPATGIKKQETKKGEVVPLKKENLNRQLTDDEIEELEIELAVSDPDGPSLSEVYPDFDGTVGSANKIRKERADYIADMEVEYKKGKLDPVAGDKSPARKKFLEKKLEEMEASGDKRLMTPDEIEELSAFDFQTNMDKATKKPTEKEMTEIALNNLIKKRFDRKRLGTISQDANARTAIREFLTRRINDGTLKIPDKIDEDAIKNFRGNVDPIDVFRKAYGEDAIGVVARVQEEFPDAFRGDSFKEIGDEFERLYKLEAENFGSELPKPKDKYGFDEGLMTDEELEKALRKDLEEKQMLEDFDVTDREPNEAGGIAGILKL
tara:strand:- start:475 stop:1599 length:1125 start_codon:yes stop_codon:yes gene_type:complete